jgi:predicted permease
MRLPSHLRRLSQVPTFTLIVITTLAVGFGSSVAIFTVVDAVLIKPLPFPEPDRLIDVSHSAEGMGVKNAGAAPFLYFTYRDEGRAFQEVGLWRRDTASVTSLTEPEEVPTLDVTADVLPLIGVHPMVGRWFAASEDTPSEAGVAILTYGYWQARFGGTVAIGRDIVVDGRRHEIVGVMPPTFRFLDENPSIILPMRLDRAATVLGNFNYNGIARLKPGTTLEAASADVARMLPIAIARYPPFPGYSRKMFEEARFAPALSTLKSSLVGDIARILWMLAAVIGLVLLIACANVANLMLVRAESRQHELAIRAALGAGRRQIARELLGESLVLAGAGAGLGLALAAGGVRVLARMGPASLPRLAEVVVDWRVAVFTFVLAGTAGILVGLVPLVKYVRPSLNTSLRAGGRSASDSRERRRASNVLVVVQVALALVLLQCAGLMIRTFLALSAVQPGFIAPEHVQTIRLTISESQVPDSDAVLRMEQAIVEKIERVAGVTSVGFASGLPMTGSRWQDPVYAEDKAYTDMKLPPLRRYRFVSPGFLATMGNRLVSGRDFTWADVYEKRSIAMVSENTATELWGSPQRALGKRIRDSLKTPWREVVGVVADEREDGVDQPAPTVAVWPTRMDDFENQPRFVTRVFTLAIRSPRTGSSGFVDDLARAIWSVNASLPVANVRTLEDIYKSSFARTSFALVMLTIAGAMALLLGVAGVYSVISYSVSQRTREIGIRMALGAERRAVTTMFLAQGARLTLTGLAVGVAAAAAVTRMMASMLFGVGPFDAPTAVAASLGLAAAALIATGVPALQATRVDPAETMRAE